MGPGSPEEAPVLPELVGRDHEMSLMLTCLEAAQHGQGNLVMCVGEPGVGKTRLAEELTRAAQGQGVATVWGRAAATAGGPACSPAPPVRGQPASVPRSVRDAIELRFGQLTRGCAPRCRRRRSSGRSSRSTSSPR